MLRVIILSLFLSLTVKAKVTYEDYTSCLVDQVTLNLLAFAQSIDLNRDREKIKETLSNGIRWSMYLKDHIKLSGVSDREVELIFDKLIDQRRVRLDNKYNDSESDNVLKDINDELLSCRNKEVWKEMTK